MTLRVVMVVTGFPSKSDPGTGIFNLRAARALNCSADVTVIHLRSWRPFRSFARTDEFDGLRVRTLAIPRLPIFPTASLQFYKTSGWAAVQRLVKECDLIHSVGLSFAGFVGAHWARLSGVRHVTQITSSTELDGSQPLPDEETMKFIDGVACNSEALAMQFHRMYPAARNVRAIYRGVDLKRFAPNGYRRVTPMRRGVRFLFLGGFPDYRDLPYGRNTKGGETLLSAWQAAEEALASSSAQLTIGGPCSTDARVQRWRAALRYPQQVHLTGTLDPSKVADCIRSCDAVLVPSLQEGFPNIAVEASACGRAVLASTLDGMAELIASGETGALIRAGDVTAWARALADFAQRHGELVVFGRNARTRAERLFDANAYPANVMHLYHAALGEINQREVLPWIALS